MEKILREYFRGKRLKDEGSIPPFTDFNAIPSNRIRSGKRTPIAIAASLTGVIAAASVILLLSKESRLTTTNTQQITLQTLLKKMPTQSLMDDGLTGPTLWHWKAPTDKLLTAPNRYPLK